MKKGITFGLLVVFLLTVFISKHLSIFNLNKTSPELTVVSHSLNDKNGGGIVAASCGFTLTGGSDEYTACRVMCTNGQTVGGRSQCGGTCTPDGSANCTPVTSCNNGANNPPSCDACPAGQAFYNNQCYPTCNTATDLCGVANTAGVLVNNICISNTTPPTCTAQNACGQLSSGYQCGGTCNATPNDQTCFSNFKMTTSSVSPNGSVEFSWDWSGLPAGVTPNCGFIDLTTPTPRPIPGLQNLDPTTDRVRINNIQATTRFCLVCTFNKLIGGVSRQIGQAAIHQWIRVIRVGEY